MPITSIPDPSIHKYCGACDRWFERDEGELFLPENWGMLAPRSTLRRARAEFTGDESLMRFRCHGCGAKRKRHRWVFWSVLIVIVAVAQLLKTFGLL